MQFELSKQAKDSIEERKIPLSWIERVLASPTRREPDRRDPVLKHLLGPIEEHGRRVLRVVVKPTEVPIRVVTVYFDRRLKETL